MHSDYLGTPRYVMDGSNNLLWKWENLDPYGNNVAQGTLEFNLRFSGQYYDSESGLHYNMFRTYEPSSKRYMQSDPMGLAAGWNTYNYVGRNPLNYIDPLGLWKKQGDSADINLFDKNGSTNMHAIAQNLNLSKNLLNYINDINGSLDMFITAGHANTEYFENDSNCILKSQCGAYGYPNASDSFDFSGRTVYKDMKNIDDFIKLLNERGYDNKKLLFLAGCNSRDLARKLSLKVKGPVMGVGGELMYNRTGIYSQYENGGALASYEVSQNGKLISSLKK